MPGTFVSLVASLCLISESGDQQCVSVIMLNIAFIDQNLVIMADDVLSLQSCQIQSFLCRSIVLIGPA